MFCAFRLIRFGLQFGNDGVGFVFCALKLFGGYRLSGDIGKIDLGLSLGFERLDYVLNARDVFILAGR